MRRFQREARATGALESPHIVQALDSGLDASTNRFYLVMEYLAGEDLQRVLDRIGPLRPEVALRVVGQALLGLAKAHEAGIVHRDIKPANLYLARGDDGAITVKLLDFGIAKVDHGAAGSASTDGLTQTGGILGSPRYMSPEQVQSAKRVDHRTDLWSLGCVLSAALTGRAPHQQVDSVGGVLVAICTTPPPPVQEHAPWVSPELAAVVRKALALHRDDRFSSAAVMLAALSPLCPEGFGLHESMFVPVSPEQRVTVAPKLAAAAPLPPVSGIETTVYSPAQPPSPRRPALLRRAVAIGLVGAALATAGIAASSLIRRSPSPAPAASMAAPVVEALACKDAVVTGEEATPELARALGVGACARLGLALGVAWGSREGAHTVVASFTLGPELSEVSLSAGGREARGRGKSPMLAAVQAAQILAEQLAPPPLSDESVRAWGARDAAGARRIERVLRRYEHFITSDIGAEAARLLATDPDSPWTQLLAMINEVYDSEPFVRAGEKALSLLDRVPPARAKALEGYVTTLLPGRDRAEGLRRLREAYREAPDDSAIALLLVWATAGSVSTSPEAQAVAERLMARSPTRAIGAVCHVVTKSASRAERPSPMLGRLIDRLREVMPESRSWRCTIMHLIVSGQLDAARDAAALRRSLGGAQVDPAAEELLAQLELAALAPEKAREHALKNIGDPDVAVSIMGHHYLIASYRLEGRLVEADTASARLLAAFRDLERQHLAYYDVERLHIERLLGRRPPPAAEIEALLRVNAEIREETDRLAQESELALARARSGGPGALEEATRVLARIEAEAASLAGGDRERGDSLHLGALPLVRLVRGDAAAAAWFREKDRGLHPIRQAVAFEAALALEATHDRAGAEQAYKLALDPLADPDAGRPFSAAAARLRLARLYRGAGRHDEAAALEAVMDRLWAHADPGVREAVLRMR